jgi:hypothetical protein
MRCAATPAWTLIAVIACATTSWISRAICSRSSPTRRSASSSRTAAVRSAACPRDRSTSPAAMASRLSARFRVITDARLEALANGTTLTTTHGTTARAIHIERRRSPPSASSNSATIGMRTTVLAGRSCQSTRTIPATSSGASRGKVSRRRSTSGRHPAKAASTLQAVMGRPEDETTASAMSTGGRTTTGSQSSAVAVRAARAATASRS